jgi:hypothetical protein
LPKHIDLSTPLDEAIFRGGPYACVRYKGAHTDMKDADRWLLGRVAAQFRL